MAENEPNLISTTSKNQELGIGRLCHLDADGSDGKEIVVDHLKQGHAWGEVPLHTVYGVGLHVLVPRRQPKRQEKKKKTRVEQGRHALVIASRVPGHLSRRKLSVVGISIGSISYLSVVLFARARQQTRHEMVAKNTDPKQHGLP